MALQVVYYAYGVFVKGEELFKKNPTDQDFTSNENALITLNVERIVFDNELYELKSRSTVFQGAKQPREKGFVKNIYDRSSQHINLIQHFYDRSNSEGNTLFKRLRDSDVYTYNRLTNSEKDLWKRMVYDK